ncbi:MAG: DUF58 domain-containing protein [Desulfuromonadales bacterium]|nr:DUF58 domain-containing protein [Desulfuromonadales bacterium]
MILPANRLIWTFGLTSIPAGLIWANNPEATALIGLLFMVALLLLCLDAWRSGQLLATLSVEAPERFNLTHCREGVLEFYIRHQEGRDASVQFGLHLAPGLKSEHTECWIDLDGEQSRAKVLWPVTPQRRGTITLESCCIRALSPFGFWIRQKKLPFAVKLHAYPNIFSERKQLAALFLNRGQHGLHLQRQVGKGREFEKLREYLPGDSLNDIHWRATAKRGYPVTKEYQIERTQEIYVVIDASRLSSRACGDESILERYITAALILNLVTQQQGDLFGLVTFDDRVTNFIRAKAGKPHFRVCQDALLNLQTKAVTPDFNELTSFLSGQLHRRSLVLFLTSLDEAALAEQFEKDMELINRKHLVLVNMLKHEKTAPLFSDAQTNSLDKVYQDLGGHMLWQELRELGKSLQSKGIDFHLLENETLCTELVSTYLNIKRRQIL